jgi:hypothetical protein
MRDVGLGDFLGPCLGGASDGEEVWDLEKLQISLKMAGL